MAREVPSGEETVVVTMLQERPTRDVVEAREGFSFTEKVVGLIGLAALAVGAWMYAIPTSWFLGGLAEGWYLGMFAGGGLMMAGAFGFSARRALGGESRWNSTAMTRTVMAVSVLMVTVALIAVLIWLL